MPYTVTDWVDGVTPVNAANLDKLEAGVADAVAQDEVTVAGTRVVANKLLLADAQPSFTILGSGRIDWGAGGASAVDTNLYRSAANVLKTDDEFHSVSPITGSVGANKVVIGDQGGIPTILFGTLEDVNLWRQSADNLKTSDTFRALQLYARDGTLGQVLIGDDGTTPRIVFGNGGDTNLYRSAPDTLTTDDQLVASGGLTTKTKAGVPTDADTATDVDGSIIMDTTNNRLYVRSGATWRYIPLGTADPVSVLSGTITQYAGASAPSGYLLCDGSAVNRTTYAALFAVTSTLYGVGDGSTTFNLPDFRGRVPVGYAAAGGHADASTLGGVESGAVALANRRPKHNHTFTQPTISSPSITQPTISSPAVNITDPQHSHAKGVTAVQTVAGGSGADYMAYWAGGNSPQTGASSTGITAALASAPTASGAALASAPVATLGAAGVGGTAATDTPAYQVVNYIIKT